MLALLAACEPASLAPLTAPTVDPAARPQQIIAVVGCSGSRTTMTVRCGDQPTRSRGAAADIIVGGQNLYVRLTPSNFSYDAGTGQYVFDVSLENLIPQPIGTTDGVTLDPNGVRIFFNSGPIVTGGTGSASVVPDGFATFTSAGQAYYQYPQVIAQNQTSPARTWTLIMSPTVTTFSFTLYVSAPVQYPVGYIDVSPGMTSMQPAEQHSMTGVPRTAVGNLVTGGATLVWGTSDASVATVDAAGVLTAVSGGPVTVTVSDGTRIGFLAFDVTGATRSWNGTVSTDFDDAANWDAVGPAAPAVVPMSADSIVVPPGVPFFPHLTAATSIAGVSVLDNASLSLDAFDLVATGDVRTTPLGVIDAAGGLLRLTGANSLVAGRLPGLLVTGRYSLAADLSCTDLTVQNGEVTNVGFELLKTP
jgi:hypothetical protein